MGEGVAERQFWRRGNGGAVFKGRGIGAEGQYGGGVGEAVLGGCVVEGRYWGEGVTKLRGGIGGGSGWAVLGGVNGGAVLEGGGNGGQRGRGGNGGAVLGGETTLPEQQYFEQNLR